MLDVDNSVKYDDLMQVLTEMEIVDSHEHLPPEAERIASDPDFSLFFTHYGRTDLLSAGMPLSVANAMQKAEISVEEKWRAFEPYYRLIQDGSYCRAAHLSMNRLYGFDRLGSLEDAVALTAKMRESHKEGLYVRTLRDVCKIRAVVNYGQWTENPEYLVPVRFATEYAEVYKKTILAMEERTGLPCTRLDAYVEAVRQEIAQHKCAGTTHGVKFHFAYMRDLHFAPTPHADAERVFNRVMEEGYGWRECSLGYQESRPLQDYMVHRIIEVAGELEIPVVFHAGLQGDIHHNLDDARPSRLWNLPYRYRNVDFIVLHSGIPWMEETGQLAKQYPNVYLDMGWTHLISPELSRRALQVWIDTVPMNKIFGFGGDYWCVEKIYGHLTLARENIARVLAGRIENEGMSWVRAKQWIQAILFDNPKRIFRLDI